MGGGWAFSPRDFLDRGGRPTVDFRLCHGPVIEKPKPKVALKVTPAVVVLAKGA